MALPTNNSLKEVLEKTLTGCFSCVITRVLLDTELLMPNLTESDYWKLNIDESLKPTRKMI